MVLGGPRQYTARTQNHDLLQCFKAHKNTPMLPIKNQGCHACFPNRTDHWLLYIHVIWTDCCKIQALPIVIQYETKTCCTSCNLSRQIATKFPKPELRAFLGDSYGLSDPKPPFLGLTNWRKLVSYNFSVFFSGSKARIPSDKVTKGAKNWTKQKTYINI